MPYPYIESFGWCSTGDFLTSSTKALAMFGAGGKYYEWRDGNHAHFYELGTARLAMRPYTGDAPGWRALVPGSYRRISGGFYLRRTPESYGGDVGILRLDTTGGPAFNLRWKTADQSINISLAEGAADIATVAGLADTTGTVHHIGWEVRLGETTGTAAIWVDGFLSVNETGKDTLGNASTGGIS